MASAVERVLDTAELLEMILLSLDTSTTVGMKTLLLSQRVSKTFKNSIDGSEKLQHALTFTLDSQEDHPFGNHPLLPDRSKVRTPEGVTFHLEMVRRAKGAHTYVYFKSRTFTQRAPIGLTGSWRRMHLITPATITTYIWFKNHRCVCRRLSAAACQHDSTARSLGELVELAMGDEGHDSKSCPYWHGNRDPPEEADEAK